MRIGVATTDFERDFSALPAETLFGKVAALGYESVQLSFGSMAECSYISDNVWDIPPEIPDGLPELARECADARGVNITALNGTYNAAHPDAAVRREGLRRFELLAAAAKTTGAEIITLCSGTRTREHMWTPHPDNDSAAAWADMCDSMARLTEIAEKYGVTLAIETEASNIIETPENVRRLLDYIGSPRLKMIMDAANLFHAGEARRGNVCAVMDHAFDLFGGDVVLAHGKDIREDGGIEFCATGEGIIDFPLMARRLREFGYRGDMIVHGVYDESKMAPARELMRRVFG